MRQIKQHGLEPMVLGDESQIVGDGVISRGEGRVLAFNFIEADEMAEAVKIANTHPGLRYGVTIEVRPWTDPRTGGAPLSSGEPLARR
jgi:hypothetical protein